MRSTVVGLVAALGLLSQGPPAPSSVVDEGTVIEDVTLVSPERSAPLPHASVAVKNGRIVRVGTGFEAGPHATRVDGRGRFLIPGLIDSHVHVGSQGPLDDGVVESRPELLAEYRKQLPRSYLAFGFTTLVDVDLRKTTLDWYSAQPDRPTLCHCGRGVHVAGGYGAFEPPQDAAAASALNLVYEPAQADRWPRSIDPRDFTPARAVERVVAAGGICVKAFVEPGFGGAANWPVPSRETLLALRAAARRRGLALLVHANAVESWRAAIDAGADVIAHGLWHWPGDRLAVTPTPEAREVIRAAARAGIRVQPTLQAVRGDLSIFDRSILDDSRMADALPPATVAYLKSGMGLAAWQAMADEYRQAIAKQFGSAATDPAKLMGVAPARATATLRLMLADGVGIVFGTDTPSNLGIGNPPGLNGRLELENWFEAGVPLARILRSATLDNAAAFGLAADVGTVQAGKRADLLLLGANPLDTIAAYDKIETVFLAGRPIPRKSLLPGH